MFYTYRYYTLTDSSVPTYIGKGKGDRSNVHPKNKTHFGNHIRKQLREDVFPIVIRIDQPTEVAAFAEERRLIALHGRLDLGTGTLYNKTDGGDGTSGHKHTPESKKLMGDLQRGKPNGQKGSKKSANYVHWSKGPNAAEVSKKLSASLIGKPRPQTDEQRKKTSEAISAWWAERKKHSIAH